MPLDIPYRRIQNLIEFFLKFPTREQLVVYLSENIAPIGNTVEVSTEILGDDGFITTQFRTGMNLFNSQKSKINLCDETPNAQALRTMKIVFTTVRQLDRNKLNFLADPSLENHIGQVLIPVTSRRIYSFIFIGDVEDLLDYSSFFECLSSILSFWEILREQLNLKKVHQCQGLDQELTARQKKIVEMIKLERTNSAIATLLGYSESLIRQETIIIYRKLGISGRRDLKKSIAS